jgi:hypothetical protein
VSRTYRNYCRPAAGTASATCRPGTGTQVSTDGQVIFKGISDCPEEPSDLLLCGAPLRNRTVDLLLTMYRSAVLQSQVDRLTCENTSTHWHSRAPDELTPAPFATQSATHFDLALSNSPPSKQALRNPIRLKRTRPSPTLTVAVPGYRFNSFMSQPPGHSDQVTRQSAHRAVTRRVAAHSPKTP